MGRQDHESSPNVVTIILLVSSYDVYAFINTRSTLSYVTPLVASKFGIQPELIEPFEVSTPVGDPVIAKRVYRDCIVVVRSHSTVADLIELDMVEFDVIMGMDWLDSCYANVDCRSKMVRFQFLGEPVLEWKVNTASSRGSFISYLKTRKMIRKGYIYHLVWVKDVKAELRTLQSIPVVNEFPDVFLDELLGLLPEREIEFAINILPDTQPISIPPYRMAPAELRELKDQLRDLLEKGFIRPSEGIRVDRQKIEAVKTWPRPTTPTKFRNFVGLAGYYRRFVEGFSSLSVPLTKLTQKALKDRLTSAPVPILPKGTDGYAIYCDTPGVGLGCVLMQHGKLVTEVKERQYEDLVLAHYKDTAPQKEKTPFEITIDGVLRYRGRLCVRNVAGLRQQVMGETHYSRYSVHPGATKMYHNIREIYWWDKIKNDIIDVVSHCPNCQHVKIEHQKPGCQAERTIQTLEDMLRACVIDFRGRWDDHLPLIEFAYNNSYHSSIQMVPYEDLYG
ncbi:uncharacterized protein [Nicotiana tomentosiformis]|uniref:uncharacterized protein n=1 Tax=Nicotiana tomentosiformis TaxID=4098 RepID=UPI00388C9540